MRANGQQLTEITALNDDGIIRPVVDRVFPFASTKEAMAYVESGRAKGKPPENQSVIVTMLPAPTATGSRPPRIGHSSV